MAFVILGSYGATWGADWVDTRRLQTNQRAIEKKRFEWEILTKKKKSPEKVVPPERIHMEQHIFFVRPPPPKRMRMNNAES